MRTGLIRLVGRPSLLISAAAAIAATPASAASVPTGTGLKVNITNRAVARAGRDSIDGETFVAAPNETFEILLSDGGSVTLAPGSKLVVRNYSFDPQNGTGRFAAELLGGSVRVMGGKLNITNAMELKSGGASIRVLNGGAFVTAAEGDLRAALLTGAMDVAAGGSNVHVDQPGFEVVVHAGQVTGPRRQPRGKAFADAAIINPGLKLGGMARLRDETEMEKIAALNAEGDNNQLNRSATANNQPTGSLNFSNLNGEVQLPGGGSISLGSTALASQNTNLATGLGDTARDLRLAQNVFATPDYTTNGDPCFLCPRDSGLTTNRLFQSGGFDYSLTSTQTPGRLFVGGLSNSSLSYQFSNGLLNSQSNFNNAGIIIPAAFLNISSSGISFVSDPNRVFTPGLPVGGISNYINGDDIIYTIDNNGSAVYFVRAGLTADRAIIFGSDPSCGQTSCDAGGSVAIPVSAYPESGQVKVTTVTGKIALNGIVGALSNARSGILDPDPSSPTNDELYLGPPTGIFSDYKNYLQTLAGISPLKGITGANPDAPVQVAMFQVGFGSIPPGDLADDPGAMRRDANNFLFTQLSFEEKTFVFAAGDVSRTSTRTRSGSSIDAFAITRGLTAADLTSDLHFRGADDPLSFRAFLPSETIGSIPLANLASTPLLVANPAGTAPSRLFQADFGLSPDGESSTISLTLGTATYEDTLDDGRAKVSVSGATIGSAHLATASSPQVLSISSPLFATSAGGSNSQPGYASYIVLENVSEAASSLGGGTINPLNASSTNFGLLRLASRDPSLGASSDNGSSGNQLGNAMLTFNTGYAAGLLEAPTTPGQLAFGTLDSLTLNGTDNSVAATVTLGGVTLQLGGASQPSAFIDKANYGASTQANGMNAALVAGGALLHKTYQHVQWGFYFGDLKGPAAGSSDPQLHTALSTWAAGTRWDGAPVQTLQGQATYIGHAIGSVVANGVSRTDVGSFTQNWNFSSRVYSMALSFPQAFPVGSQSGNVTYSLSLTPTAGAPGIQYTGLSGLVQDVQARVQGELVRGTGAGQPTLPQGTIGQFQLLNTAGTYSAVGTFAGDNAGPH